MNMNIRTGLRKYKYEYEYSSHTGLVTKYLLDTLMPKSKVNCFTSVSQYKVKCFTPVSQTKVNCFTSVTHLVESEDELGVGGEQVEVVPAASSTEARQPLGGRAVRIKHVHQHFHIHAFKHQPH